jgi:beta-phosphoglucomutase-like phosphatase (HAD superfamily)
VRRLAAAAVAAGWKLAVASTSAEPSVRAVLEHVVGPSSAGSFLVLAGDVVPRKKPAPDIYLLALQRLGVPASDTLVIEDSKNGVDAAAAAGIRCLVTVSDYTRGEDFTAAGLVVSSLGDPGGEQTQILSNAANVTVDGWVGLQTLESLLTAAN